MGSFNEERANEEIVLAGVEVKTNRNGTRYQETRLFKFYVDGKTQSKSVYSGRIFKISRRKWKPLYQDNVIDWLPDDLDHVLVQMNIHERRYPSVFKLNVIDGSVQSIKKSTRQIQSWMTDQQHIVRLGYSFDDKYTTQKIWIKNIKEDDWEVVWEFDVDSITSVYPKGFSLDGNILYFTKYRNDKLALFTKNLKTKVETLVYEDTKYDINGALIYSPKTHDVVGFYHAELPTGRYYLDKDYQKEQNSIDSILKDTTNVIVSTSENLDTYILYSDSSDKPGTYYLGQKKKNSLSKLFSTFPELENRQNVGSKLVIYKARDGLDIEAYLSMPKNQNQPIATVIFPHGGPGARDYIDFDQWTEFLVNRGYAVLRPNFRGSEGYGFEFSEAQKSSWGMAMQDDITDSVKWLVDNKITDPKNVCIFGASYGGYAALMGAVKTPDLFKCAISFAGVTDLVALRNTYRRTSIYQKAKRRFGSDETVMTHNSPRYRTADIKIPILLLHGEVDKVVDVEHSQWMAENLKRDKKEFKYVELPDGSHHMSIQSNRTTVFKEIEIFLAEHLE